jgi:hypothetical protein
MSQENAMERIMGIVKDLTGLKTVYRQDTLREIPNELWEGFCHDIREEFEVGEDFTIGADWKVIDLWAELLDYKSNQAKESEGTEHILELPVRTLVITVDDEVHEGILADLEVILAEKHDLHFALTEYTPKEGKMEPTLRRLSNADIEKYHDIVTSKFQK